MWFALVVMCVTLTPLTGGQHDQRAAERDRRTAAAFSDLCSQLHDATLAAETLYAQTSSRSAGCLQAFLKAVPGFGDDAIVRIDRQILINGPSACRGRFDYHVKRLRHNAHVAAEYNADNHQKFFLSHMLVLRMHINKCELFLKRAEAAMKSCNTTCPPAVEANLVRWHHTARQELLRVRTDTQHSRLAYRDLLLHSARRLARVRRRAEWQISSATRDLARCVRQ